MRRSAMFVNHRVAGYLDGENPSYSSNVTKQREEFYDLIEYRFCTFNCFMYSYQWFAN